MWSFIEKNKNDICYLSLLLFSVVIGPYYRAVATIDAKKWIGSLIGLHLIIIVSGYSAAHPILSALFGIIAIKLVGRKRCHVVAFFFMFGYLFVFRLADKFGLPPSSGQTNLIEMIIVLRVVGVAFEINGSYLSMKRLKKIEKRAEREVRDQENNERNERENVVQEQAVDASGIRQRRPTPAQREVVNNEPEQKLDYDFMELIDPDFIDLFHYSFNYIGLLTGPYYRYRTFNDYFRLPYSKYVDCFGFTVNTLKTVPLYISLYLAFSSIWPLEYVLTEEHNNRNFLYRMLYPWALFAAFRQRIYSGMTLAESVCTAAGLGAYPVQGRNRSGHGPTTGYLKLKAMTDEEAKKAQYDFNTVESMDVWGCETVVTLRDSMKVWNKAVQYWVAMVVYKRFPIKSLKIHAALFVSVIWHGFHAGYFFCIYACPFYLMAEDIYFKIYYKHATGTKRKVIGFIMWFLRSHSESYQAAAFLLLTFDRIWTYYSSVYHYWYGCWLVFLAYGLIVKQLYNFRAASLMRAREYIPDNVDESVPLRPEIVDRQNTSDNENIPVRNDREDNARNNDDKPADNEDKSSGTDNGGKSVETDDKEKSAEKGKEDIVIENDKEDKPTEDKEDKSSEKDNDSKLVEQGNGDKSAETDNEDKSAGTDTEGKSAGTDNEGKSASTGNEGKTVGTDNKGKSAGTDNDSKSAGIDNEDKSAGTENVGKSAGTDNDGKSPGTDNDGKSAGKDIEDEATEKNNANKLEGSDA